MIFKWAVIGWVTGALIGLIVTIFTKDVTKLLTFSAAGIGAGLLVGTIFFTLNTIVTLMQEKDK